MRGEVVARIVGRGQDRDPEPVVQRARPEGGLGEPRGQLVVDRVGRRRRRPERDAEDLHQLVLEPVADRRAAKHVPVRAHPPPHGARRLLRQRPLRDAELVEPHARRMQQPRHVVVRRHQQGCRVSEWLVLEQHARVHVPMRRDHRQLAHSAVQLARDRPDSGLGGQQTIRVERERHTA